MKDSTGCSISRVCVCVRVAFRCLARCRRLSALTIPFPLHTVAGSLIEFVPVFTVQYPLFVTTLIKAQLQQRVFFIYHVY
jgi:hypothetical protein